MNGRGRYCGCGRRGCLETYVSTAGLIRTYFELLSELNEVSVLKGFPPEQLSARLIYNAAINGEKLAISTFERTGQILGEALANVVAYLSPQAIILSEGLAMAGELLIKPTKYHMELNMLNLFKNKVDILVSAMNEGDSAILGASALVWHEIQKERKYRKIISPAYNEK
jgi:glucokinase